MDQAQIVTSSAKVFTFISSTFLITAFLFFFNTSALSHFWSLVFFGAAYWVIPKYTLTSFPLWLSFFNRYTYIISLVGMVMNTLFLIAYLFF